MRPFLHPGESRTERDGDGVRLEWREEGTNNLKWVTWSLDEMAELERTGRILNPAPITTLTPAEELRQLDDELAAFTARIEGTETRMKELRRKHPGIDGEEP